MGNCYPSASALPTPPGMEISIDAIQLPCMLCKRQFSPEQFRNHLDNVHFMSIKDGDEGVTCQCLICGQISPSSERHNNHLEKAHFSFEQKVYNSSPQILDLNSELRKRVKQVPMDFISNVRRIEGEDSAYYQCQYLGHLYVLVETQQDDVLGLEQKYVVSNLVWKQIFTKYRDAEYFAIESVGDAKRGYLLLSY